MVHDSNSSDLNDLGVHGDTEASGASGDAPVKEAASPAFGGWFDLNALWAPALSDSKRTPDFIVIEEGAEAL